MKAANVVNEAVTYRSGVNPTMSCKGHLTECWVSTQPIMETHLNNIPLIRTSSTFPLQGGRQPSPLEGEGARRAGEGVIARGFTLIELLVVVLIIGILAAVALPQYQLVVAKSRFATLKNLAVSIKNAQELYYMTNGNYATKFEDLDIDMPGGKLDTSTTKNYEYDWGFCALLLDDYVSRIDCRNSLVNMEYRIYFTHSAGFADQRFCTVRKTTDTNDWRGKICANETKDNNPTVEQSYNYIYWVYQ